MNKQDNNEDSSDFRQFFEPYALEVVELMRSQLERLKQAGSNLPTITVSISTS
jgi:hypothetical protein